MRSAILPLLLPCCFIAEAAQAASPGWSLVDAGRPDDGAGPIALVVETPGLAPQAMLPLVEGLEAQGLDVWTLRVEPWAEDPDAMVQVTIPGALLALPRRPCLLVGHGPGGTLAAQALLSMPAAARPQALGLLGAPLHQEPRRLYTWLAERPRPPGGMDLASLADQPQDPADPPVLEILLGPHPPALGRISGPMLDRLLQWGSEGLNVDLSALDLPIWAGAGSADSLGPPESIRGALGPQHHFQRFGRASLLPRDLDSGDLLSAPQPAQRLGAWAQDQLMKQGAGP